MGKWKQDPAYYRRWRAQNKDKKAATNKRWYEKNRDKISAINKAYKDSSSFKRLFPFTTYKHGAKKRGLAFEVTRPDFEAMREKPCWYCGAPGPSGVDRVDNAMGYIEGNMVPCCFNCNRMKMHQNLQEFLDACVRIAKKRGGEHR